MLEEYFRRSMLLSRGSFLTFFEHPISATLLTLLALFIGWQIFTTLRGRKAPLEGETQPASS
jgi:TctA family transporter